MKYFAQLNTNAKHNYELVCVDDNGNEIILPLNKKTTDNYLYMPECVVNDTNRRLVSIAMIEKSKADRFEINPKEHKEPRKLDMTNRKGLEEYLEGEDKEMYLALIEKAKKAREEANKKAPMSDLEKAMRAVERAQAKLAELQAKENA